MNKQNSVLLTNAIVYTGVPHQPPLNHGAVLISGSTIKEVGPASLLEEKYSTIPRIDLKKRLLMPGLVNTHTHLNMTIFRGLAEDLPLDDWLAETYRFRKTYMTEETQRLGVRLSLAESIKNGVTTIADMSFYQYRYIDAIQSSGIRALLYDTIMDGYLDSDRPDEMIKFIKGKTPERLIPGAALHAPYSTSPELLEWFMTNVVEPTGVPYAIHLAETREETEQFMATYGKSSTKWLEEHDFLTDRLLAVHGVWLDEEDLSLLKTHEVGLSHNPESNMKLGAGIADVTAWLDRGLDVGLGTDSAASNNDLNLFSEMDAAGKLQKVNKLDPQVLPADEIVNMATLGGAKTLGLDQVIGSIEPGKQADLITIDLSQLHLRPVYQLESHLAYSIDGHDVRDVWIAGKSVMRERKLLTIDEESLFKEIDEANHQINKQRKRDLEASTE